MLGLVCVYNVDFLKFGEGVLCFPLWFLDFLSGLGMPFPTLKLLIFFCSLLWFVPDSFQQIHTISIVMPLYYN